MTTLFFVTGTDTDVGKTRIATAMLDCAAQIGLSTLGYKPVSAGCELTPQGLRNADALALQQASSLSVSYEQVNPIAYADPVAPHLAAKRQGERISLAQISQGLDSLLAIKPDILLVEGAGGWRLPLGHGHFMSDFAAQRKMPVILVVGMKLGCLNHALLTVEAIKQDGLPIAGWIANQIVPQMDYYTDNLQALGELIDAPLLGSVPFLDENQSASPHLKLSSLFTA